MLKVLSLIALATQVAASGATAQGHELRGEALMTALRSGGYTVLLRHARTLPGGQESATYTAQPRSQQRNLSDAGVTDSRLMGTVFKKFEIPFSEVLASPLFRTMETAEYAVGPATALPLLRTWPTTAEQKALIAKVPAPGTNRLIVTHHFLIEDHVDGISPGDILESEGVVLRADGNGSFALVGRIKLADWQALGAQAEGEPVPAPQHTQALRDSPAARILHDYIAAYQSADTTTMRRFIESSLIQDPARPTTARVETYQRMLADYGPLTVLGIESVTPDVVTVRVDSRRGAGTLTVRASATHPGRAESISLGIGGHP